MVGTAIDSDRFDVMMIAYHHGIWPQVPELAARRAREERDMGVVAMKTLHDVLRHRMYFEDYGWEKEGIQRYAALAKNASVCASCSAPCVGTCPVGIDGSPHGSHWPKGTPAARGSNDWLGAGRPRL